MSSSERGIFDPSLPVQGIFDSVIFDTQSIMGIDTILIPVLVHGISEITVGIHGNEEIVVK